MGEIAEMMLDGTMDCETGEWNSDGEDGPGWPMTQREAAQYRRASRGHAEPEKPIFTVSKKLRAKIEAFGILTSHNAYHWTVRRDNGAVIAHWYPHKTKRIMDGKTVRGDEAAFLKAIAKPKPSEAASALDSPGSAK